MRRILFLSAALLMTLSLAACGRSQKTAAPKESGASRPEETGAQENTAEEAAAKEEKEDTSGEEVELVVFAAASMNETLDKIIDGYKKAAPNVTITPTYDSSGTLKTQIEEGAYCDLFISAAQKQMNQLDASKDKDSNPQGLDFVLEGTRVDLLENKVVLAVPDNNRADIQSFQDLASDKVSLLCIGNEDVPVGAYSEEILTWLGVLDSLKKDGKLTYGSNVKEVTTQVSEGTVDAGIIYATDAFSAGLTVVDQAAPEMCRQVIYPAAVLNITEHEKEASDFLSYLQGDEAAAVFESVGFATIK